MHRSYIYPVQGRASCPPSKNVPTAIKNPTDLICYRRFGKIGRTSFVEGHEALPCTGTIVARIIVTFASIWNYAGVFPEPMVPDIMRKCTNTKKVIGMPNHSLHFRREDRIRTCDHLVPNQERYRTALLPESVVFVLRVQRYNNLFIPQNFSLFFFLIYKRIETSHSSC